MAEPSGAQWCAKFPTSKLISDLTPDFAAKVMAFINAMEAGGVNVSISATYRPAERAYLMHWAWAVANNQADPAAVPVMDGVDIEWLHKNDAGTPDLHASILAAHAMIAGYGMAHAAALNSRHTERLAIDMTLSWEGVASIRDAEGNERHIGAPRDGMNGSLWIVGKTYGVIKLASDPPHFSSDGH